jgi:glyoxylase-like metal-dependent hydrolase (beta-lactamase superfamily II)
MSYELIDGESGTVAVITGGSLLHGSTGRTDLLGAEHTEELTHAQFHSARRLATELPANTTIYPTHGFGWRYTWGAPLTLIGDDATVLTA